MVKKCLLASNIHTGTRLSAIYSEHISSVHLVFCYAVLLPSSYDCSLCSVAHWSSNGAHVWAMLSWLFITSAYSYKYCIFLAWYTMQLQVENSIWHAFDYLAVETGRHCASKSKLKVIITSIPIIITLTILNEFLCWPLWILLFCRSLQQILDIFLMSRVQNKD